MDLRQNGQVKKQQNLNQSFNQKYEKLKSLYMRQGARSSQSTNQDNNNSLNINNIKSRDNSLNNQTNQPQRILNFTPKENNNFYQKTKIYNQGMSTNNSK